MTYPPDFLINGSGKGGKGKGGKGKGGKGGPPGGGKGGKGGPSGGGKGNPGSGKGGGKGTPQGGANGENCWYNCNEMDGPCDWCGDVGLCCRKEWIGNGCNGSIGGASQHECVLNPGTNILSENLQKQKSNSVYNVMLIFLVFNLQHHQEDLAVPQC